MRSSSPAARAARAARTAGSRPPRRLPLAARRLTVSSIFTRGTWSSARFVSTRAARDVDTPRCRGRRRSAQPLRRRAFRERLHVLETSANERRHRPRAEPERRAQLAVHTHGQRHDRDRHRVPRPDLHECLARVGRSTSTATTSSSSASAFRFGPSTNLERNRPFTAHARDHDASAADEQRWQGVTGRRRVLEVPRRSSRGSGSGATRPCVTPPRAPAGAPRAAPPSLRHRSARRPAEECRSRATNSRSSGTSLRFRSAGGRKRSKFSATITSVPPASGTASGRSAFSRSASSSECGPRTSTAF